MKPSLRDRFDRELEQVLAALPVKVHRLLDEVPLHVEDHPPREVMQQLDVEERDELCGLYTGVPLTERRCEDPARLPDAVVIYREGIVEQARDDAGRVNLAELRRQMRITVLHELGHHHGLTEADLTELGYE